MRAVCGQEPEQQHYDVDDNDDDYDDDDGSVFITPLLRARAVCLWPKQTPAPSTFGPHL